MAPMPMSVVTTGMPKRSAKARSSGAALLLLTPPPTYMSGRSAAASSLKKASASCGEMVACRSPSSRCR